MEELVNVIIVADHGMVDNSKLTFEKLSDHLSEDSFESIDLIVDSNYIAVKDQSQVKIDQIYNELSNWHDMKIFKIQDLPDYYRGDS